MDFYTKLPRNKKEFIIFLAAISIISLNIIAPIITCLEVGFSIQNWINVMKKLPLLWPSVIIVVLLTYKPAEWLTSKVVKREDSFNAVITINTLCSVLCISIPLTIIGTWIGTEKLSIDPIMNFIYIWPRNVTISFLVESLIAQPTAIFIMTRIHIQTDGLNSAI